MSAPYLQSKFILLIISVLLPLWLFSQTEQKDFPFRSINYINSKDGLNGNEVYWLMQDSRGFVWIVTDKGLNRYDGYSIRFYPFHERRPDTLAYGQPWGLSEDENGVLWIPTTMQGLLSFDPKNEKYSVYPHDVANKNSLAGNSIYSIVAQPGGNIWIAYPDSGLDKLDIRNKTVKHFFHRNDDSSSISDNYLYCLVKDENNKKYIWIINHNRDVECFNTESGKVIRRFKFPYPDSLFIWPNNACMNINGMRNGTIWMGSNDHGIFGFNTNSGKFIFIEMKAVCRKSRHILGMYHVLEDRNGNLWTTNDNNEIVYYNRTKDQFYFYPVEENNLIFNDNPALLFQDNSGKIWISSTNGLVTVDTWEKKIYVCKTRKYNPNSIASNIVFAIHRTRQGKLLVASDRIDVFDRKTQTFTPLHLEEDGKPISAYGVWRIYEDKKNIIWFTGMPGIFSYDPLTGKCHEHHLRNDTGELKLNFSVGMVEDKQGKLWFGNWGHGLVSFDPAGDKARTFTMNTNQPNSISTNQAGPVWQDSKGIIYVFGSDGGYITFDPVSETFKIFHHNESDSTSVNSEFCHSMIENKNGLIWFGTIGGGIGVFNPKTEKFRAFTSNDGLPDNTVVNLMEDRQGNYWASTTNGISCFTPPSDPFSPGCKIHFRNYDESDGLPSNTLNKISAFCDMDGTLYFGTYGGGMFYFHPEDLRDNDSIPPVYITEFSLLNKRMNLNDSGSILQIPIEYTREIFLNYQQSTFSFSFAALNFNHPEKNKYSYMLEGFDKDWIHADASKRFATYTNLDPGEYIFKVKGSNNDGIWNQKPTELRITITPPFWQTLWFKILSAAFLLSIAYSFYRYRLGQVLLLQKIRNKIAHDLHDDIGSTLNSISVFSEVAKRDEGKRMHALEMIGDSSRKVIDALSDIVWSINPENDSFENIILRMRSIAYNLFKAKDIQFSFKADEVLNSLKLSMQDRRNFYLVFKEAINNIIKYSNATKTNIELSRENNFITLLIHDNGIGFDTSAPSRGNGINSMKKRAEEMQGKFRIESEPGQGTLVQLSFAT